MQPDSTIAYISPLSTACMDAPVRTRARARFLRTSAARRPNDGVPCANSGLSLHSHFTVTVPVTVPADGSWGRQCRTATLVGKSLVLSSSPSSLAPCRLTIHRAFRYAPQGVWLRVVERCNRLHMRANVWLRVVQQACVYLFVPFVLFASPLCASVSINPINVLTTVYGIVPRQDRDRRRARARPPRVSSQRARVSLHRQLVALRFVDGR